MAGDAESGIAQGLDCRVGGDADASGAVGEVDDGFGDAVTALGPGVQKGVGLGCGLGEDLVESAGEVDGVLDAGVHALAAGGGVDVGGVSGEEDATPAEVGGEAVMDAEARGPEEAGDAGGG